MFKRALKGGFVDTAGRTDLYSDSEAEDSEVEFASDDEREEKSRKRRMPVGKIFYLIRVLACCFA